MEETAPATKTEQKEGTEDSTITPVSKTDVIEKEDKSETSNEGILEKETEDTSTKTEPQETEPEDPDAAQTFNTDPAAAESVNPYPITVYEYETNKVGEDDALPAGTIVVPHYLSGEENGQATGSGNLVFQLEVQDGWLATDVATATNVQYRIQKTDAEGNTSWLPTGAEGWANVSKNGDGNYQIDLNGDNGLKGSERKKCFTGPIEIKVVASKNTATLDATGVTDGVYFVGIAEDGGNGDVISGESAAIPFEKFTNEITLLAKAKADDTVKIEVEPTGQTATGTNAVEMTRGGEVEIGEGESKVTWTQFTIDPKTLPGYADCATAAGTSFVVTKVDGPDPNFTYALDNSANMKYDFDLVDDLATNVPNTAEIYYFTLVDNSGTIEKPARKTMKTYLTTEEDGVKKRNVLLFKVTADSNAEITGVKAELTADSASTKVLQTIEAGTGNYGTTDATAYYSIDLGEVDSSLIKEAVTLTLKADTIFKGEDDEFGNHKITFTGDLENLEIKQANDGGVVADETEFTDDSKVLSTSFDTDASTLNFAVRAKDGYAITIGTDYNSATRTDDAPVVTVSYTKRYELNFADHSKGKDYVETRVVNKELKLTHVEAGIHKLGDDVAGLIDTNALVLGKAQANGDSGWIGTEDWQIPSADKTTYDEGNDVNNSGNPAAYSYKDITINIRTTTDNNQTGYFDVVSDELEYTVETGNGVEPGEKADRYNISEDADFVVLNITSAGGAPTVVYKKVGNADETFAENKMVKDGDTYKVKIPVTALNGSDPENGGTAGENSNINSTITITRGTYTFTVKNVDTPLSPADFAGDIKIGNGTKKAYTAADAANENDIVKGETVPVVLYAETGTEFKTVKVVTGTGEDAKTEEITLGEDKTTLELSLAMTDAVEVQITTNNVYGVILTRDPAATSIEKGEDGVYVIPVGAKNIVAKLKNGGSAVNNIAYAKLYDGDQEAASTVALVDGDGTKDAAKIAKISDKDTGVLRLELVVKNGNKYVPAASIQMRQEKAASKMSITSPYDGSAVTEFNQAPDTATAEYNVKADEGTLSFSDSDVVMELAADASRTTGTQATYAAGTYTITNNDVNITFTPAADEKQLKITAKPSVNGDKSYVLRFYDKAKRAEAAKTNAADRICAVEGGTIEVKIAPPAVKSANFKAEALDATNTTLRIQVSSDAIALHPDSKNKAFYRVTLGSADKVGTGKDALGNAVTISKDPQYYAVSGASQILEFHVNPLYNTKGEEYSDPQEFHPTVELVQTTACDAGHLASIDEAKKQGTSNKLSKSDAVALTTSTKEARYEHELTLNPAKATVYLGQVSTVATTAQFSEKTGFAEVQVTGTEFINTKTGKKLENTNMTTSLGENGEVYINATGVTNSYYKNNPDYFKNIGLKVSAKATGDTKPSSAILSLKVVAGVSSITFENGMYQSIFKQPGKAATFKVKAVLNDGKKENAPKKKKFTYALGDKNGKLPGEAGYQTPAPAMSALKINQKNGTVTIPKTYEVDAKEDNNKFSVVAQEIYSGARAEVRVTITGTAQAVSRVVIVDEDGKVVAANGILRADDFYDGTTAKSLYVRALSATAGTKRVYTAITDGYSGLYDNYMSGVKYTSNAKSVLSVDPRTGELTLLKASKKPVKLTVASADGSKDKGQSISVDVQSYSDVALRMYSSAVGVATTGKEKDPVVKYDGAANTQFTLYPAVKVNGQWTWAPSDYFKNFNIKIKKAKKLKLEKTATRWSIVKTDAVSTVTISDKSNKGVSSTYEITQNPAAPVGAKTLKVKSLTKLTQPMIESARNAQNPTDGTIKLKYQLTGKSKGLYTGQYIMLTPDYTKTKKVAGLEEYRRSQINFLGGDGSNSKVVRIDGNDGFEIELNMWHMTNQERIPGSYTLIATAGTYQNGEFVPATKGANIKIKIPGKAPKALSLKLNGTYSLDESGAPVSIETGISSAFKWYLGDDANDNDAVGTDYALNMIDPETGKPNSFTKYFKVVKTSEKDSKGNRVYKIGLKENLKVDEIEKLRENSKDCQGYVTVQTSDQRQDMLITVTLADSEIKGMTKDSYKGAEATVQFFAGTDTTTPIEVAAVAMDAAASQGAPSFVKAGTHVADDNKSVKIKLGAAEKDKSYEVTFKVLAANSAYAKAKTANNSNVTINDAYVQKYGRTVTATFYVVDPAKAQGAVWFEPVNKDLGLAFTAFSEATYNKAKNMYSLDIKQESAIDGAKISAIKIAANSGLGNAGMNIKAKTGTTDVFTLTLERDRFLKVVDSEGAALKRGAEVEIPVEVTYSNREIPAETIKVPVTLPDPMNVDAAIEAAKAAVAEVEQIKVIDLQNRDADGYDSVMEKLQTAVNTALLKAVPLDAVADINLPITLAEDDGTKENKENPVVTWRAVINIKEKRTDKTPKWTYTLKFAPEYEMKTASQVATAIAALTTINQAGIEGTAKSKVDNNYTAEMLKADILKLLKEAGTVDGLPANLNLVVEKFSVRKATTTANGSVKADIYVYDAMTKGRSGAVTIGNGTSDLTVKAAIVVEKLGTIKVNADKIEAAIANAANKVDYQKVIYDALNKTGASIDDVESALETAILNAANGSIRNSGVTVEFKLLTITAQNVTDGDYDNAGLNASGDARNVAFKLPTGGDSPANGSVKFQLVVKQEGVKDYLIDKATSPIVVTPLRKVGDVENVKVFQTLTEAAANVAKITGDGAIFETTAPTAVTEGAMKDAIDKTTTGAIATEVVKRVKTRISGVGLDASAEVTLVTEAVDGTTATDKTLGGTADLYAHGTITITDNLERDDDATLKFVVLVPAGDTATVSGIDVKIEKVVGSTKTELTATGMEATPPSVDVGFIGADAVKIQFTSKLVGYWLTDADNDFTYSITDTSNGAPDGTNKLNNGFSIAGGVLTITPSQVDASLKDGAVKTVRVKIAHNKRIKGETNDTGKNDRVYKRDVKIKFTTATTAKALLATQTDGSAYDWNATTPVKASYKYNATSTKYELDGVDTLKTDLATKANNWLKAAEQGHTGFTVTAKTVALDSDTIPTKATVVFTITRGADTQDTAALDLDLKKTASVLAKEADTLAKGASVKTAIENLNVTGTDLSAATDAEKISAVKAKIDATSAIGTALTNAGATLTVTEAKINAGGDKLEIKYTVTITEDSVSGTCEPVSAEVGYSAS